MCLYAFQGSGLAERIRELSTCTSGKGLGFRVVGTSYIPNLSVNQKLELRLLA